MLDTVIARHADVFAEELVGVMIDTPGNLAQLLDRRIEQLDEDSARRDRRPSPPPVPVADRIGVAHCDSVDWREFGRALLEDDRGRVKSRGRAC